MACISRPLWFERKFEIELKSFDLISQTENWPSMAKFFGMLENKQTGQPKFTIRCSNTYVCVEFERR